MKEQTNIELANTCIDCNRLGKTDLCEKHKKEMREKIARIRICVFCHHTWISRKKEPRACPRCKRYGWGGITNENSN